MTTRITGLATGLDVDTIVKQTMQAYRTKIDTQQQKKDVTEIKQQLYRDIIKEAQELYNTHFDVLKSGSLVRVATWQSVKFETNSKVLTVTGDSTAKVGNYTIQGNGVIAKASKLSKESLGEEININGQAFKIKEDVSEKEQAIDLNNQLAKAGINVSVKYTNFAGNEKDGNLEGFVFESKILGKDNNFVIGGVKSTSLINNGTDATGAEITGLTVEMLKNNSIGNKAYFEINNKEFTIDIAEKNENSDIEKLLNSELSEKGYTAKVDYTGNITLIATERGNNQNSTVTIKVKNSSTNNYDTINTILKNGEDATSAKLSTALSDLKDTISINGVVIDFSILIKKTSDTENLSTEIKPTNEEKINYINKILIDKNMSITASTDGEKFILESSVKGSSSKIDFSYIDGGKVSEGGQDANIIISNGSGVHKHTGITNNFTLDGINFNFTGDVGGEDINVTSKQDSTEIIDKIKSYIEDYNELIVKINTLTSEKRDRNYQPLTSDQKAEMSEKEIELWEAKVKQGQLRRDSDLTRLVNSLKQGMSTMVSGSGLTLENIGISSVQDYGGTKDGTFKINETTLKEAIENNTEQVSKLFMQSAPSGVSEEEVYNQKGIMMRLKDILYDETVSSKSVLAKKVGFEGTTTVANNTLTKQMTEYQKKIDEMEDLFADKEQALYTKYSKLETIMNNYNSQMTYLSQALGLSTS